jgi:hypothetical protein
MGSRRSWPSTRPSARARPRKGMRARCRAWRRAQRFEHVQSRDRHGCGLVSQPPARFHPAALYDLMGSVCQSPDQNRKRARTVDPSLCGEEDERRCERIAIPTRTLPFPAPTLDQATCAQGLAIGSRRVGYQYRDVHAVVP